MIFTKKTGLLLLVCFSLASCMTYYQKHAKFNAYFEQGNLPEAEKIISADKRSSKNKNRLLHFLNRGVITSMQGKYAESNTFFEQAYIIAEDYEKKYADQALALLTNSNAIQYKGEDFEILLIHYYKALNYLKLNNREAALVECRRMNIKLNKLNDKYTSNNKYKKDAFIQTFMGIIYDANADYNNAFIAYRNAYDIYKSDYKTLFNMEVPEQLKKDLLRAAARSGFHDEVAFYEKEFNTKYKPGDKNKEELVFLWNNGLGPVKSEWSINFNIIRGQGGNVIFQNTELGLSIPFYIEDKNYKESGLSDLEFIRVAFPKYVERGTLFNEASLIYNDEITHLNLAQDINGIAFKSLQDRMLKELGTSLLRLALKKAAEYSARKQNNNVGAAIGLFNALTEKADTRNWQSIPHSIYYTRLQLPSGKQNLKLETRSSLKPDVKKTHDIEIDVIPGATTFGSFHSLETIH